MAYLTTLKALKINGIKLQKKIRQMYDGAPTMGWYLYPTLHIYQMFLFEVYEYSSIPSACNWTCLRVLALECQQITDI